MNGRSSGADAMRLEELLRQACEVKAWSLVELNRRRLSTSGNDSHEFKEPFVYEACSTPRVETRGIFTPWRFLGV